MRTLLFICFAFILTSAKAQQSPVFDVKKYLQKKNEDLVKKLQPASQFNKNNPGFNFPPMLKDYSAMKNPETKYFMPVTIEQHPTIGIMPTKIEQPPTLGIMPGAKKPDAISDINRYRLNPGDILFPKKQRQ